MKTHLRNKLFMFFVIMAITFVSFAQGPIVPYWKLNGNPNLPGPADGVNNTNNFLGSSTGNNTWLRMGVNGSQDIFIDNNPAQLYTGSAASGAFNQGGHWIGLGRVFTPQLGPGAFPIFAPKAHLHIHGNNTTGSFGFTGGIRNWFNTGVLMTENSDGMYVGLRSLELFG